MKYECLEKIRYTVAIGMAVILFGVSVKRELHSIIMCVCARLCVLCVCVRASMCPVCVCVFGRKRERERVGSDLCPSLI